MKKALTLILALTIVTAVSAHSKKSKQPVSDNHTARRHKSPERHTAGVPDNNSSANYIGTNDFYLALVREGMRHA